METYPINPELRERMVARIMRENDFSHELADNIINETLMFLHASVSTNAPIGPSKLVDIGWHTFILYTHDYAQYCQNAFGRFVHHEPSDKPGEVGEPLSHTLEFFVANGIAYDPELWGVLATCSDGHSCQSRSCGTKVGEAKADCNSGGGNCTGCRTCGPQVAEPVLAMADQLGCVGQGGGGACGTQITGCTERCSTNCK